MTVRRADSSSAADVDAVPTRAHARVALRDAEQRRRKKDAQQDAVVAIGLQALQGADAQVLMMSAITSAATGLDADLAGVLMANDDRASMTVLASYGAPPGVDRGTAVPIGRDHAAGRAMEEGIVVTVSDYSGQTEFVLHPNLAAVGIRASLYVPIPGEESQRAVLAFHAKGPREWDQDDRIFAQELATLLSVTLVRLDAARREEAARDRQRQFEKAVFDNLTDMVVACNSEGQITAVNRALRDFIGDAPIPTVAGGWSEDWQWSCRDDGSSVRPSDSPLRRALRGEVIRGVEYIIAPPAVPPRTVVADGSQFRDSQGELMGAVIVLHDVTEQRQAENGLVFQQLHDDLTGLPNRTLFMDRTERALQRAQRHGWTSALLAINIDDFKTVNARFGRKVGDGVLAEVAGRLMKAMRPYDSISRRADVVARFAGDEFLILCEDVGGAVDADQIAQRIVDAVSVPMSLLGHVVNLSVRMGVTLSSDSANDADMLIMEAETAMRLAKQDGPGHRRLFVEAMRSEHAVRGDREEALRRALETGELRLAFQPKVAISTERLVGVEALLRWQHPERGIVPPMEFIPLAEETGLIVPIGTWVLHQACTEARRWRDAFPSRSPITVSVNVSARQFDSDLAGILREVLDSTGADPTTVCLEVTESSVMRDPEFAVATLRAFKAMGFKVSIDDFGTGYSSLAYLRRFPLDELKVDKSFVDGLGRDPEATAIVAAVMGMAHALDLTVVAEGVETDVQLLALRGLGCDEAQGYYYARPQWACDIDRLLQDGVIRSGVTDAPRPDASGAPDEHAQMGIGTVVVVDDASDVRLLARSSLAAAGFHVYESEGGEAALALIRAVRPDCVLLDLNMPDIGGLDMCRVVRADPSTKDTTIVMVSADGEAPDKAEAFLLDVDDYIVKPFAPRDLVSRVAAALRRRRDGGRREGRSVAG